MPIELARIDDRLVHAQVVEGWLKSISINHIVVISDEVAGDEIQKTMYSIIVPYGTKISCFGVAEAVKKLKEKEIIRDDLLLLMPSLKEAVDLIAGGVEIKSFNVGGLHAKSGKKFYTPTISLDDADYERIKFLKSKGIELETRVLPMDTRADITSVIKDGKIK